MDKTVGANVTYIAAAGSTTVVTAKPAILHRIIFGADVASSVVVVSDHPSATSTDVKMEFNGSALETSLGSAEVSAHFKKGISVTSTNQTDITVVWSPTGPNG